MKLLTFLEKSGLQLNFYLFPHHAIGQSKWLVASVIDSKVLVVGLYASWPVEVDDSIIECPMCRAFQGTQGLKICSVTSGQLHRYSASSLYANKYS